MKFRVRGVTEESGLKIVQIEPVKGSLLLENDIPPGCIQYIVSNLLKHGKGSKDICDKMCQILCGVYLDDCSFRKSLKNTLVTHSHTFVLTRS